MIMSLAQQKQNNLPVWGILTYPLLKSVKILQYKYCLTLMITTS